jgi:uncharacterized protein (TIGR03437 family)
MISNTRIIQRAACCAIILMTALVSSVAAQQAQVTVVSAASYASDKTAPPDSIAAAFGTFRTQDNQTFTASTRPLPTTLGGVKVRIGNTDAGLFFVSPTQINLLIPGSTPVGETTVTMTNADNSTLTGTFTVAPAAPGIFTALSNGQGTAAALTTFDGANYQAVANPDGSARDVSAGSAAQTNFLILYGTGIRNTPAANPNDGNGVAESVIVSIQGVPCTVAYAGAQGGFDGLDQINVAIPPTQAGFGSVVVQLKTNNKNANPVNIKIGGQTPIISTQAISAGQTVSGSLTINDQVQKGVSETGSFFYDAFRFTAAANTSVAVDLRSTQFDAAVLIYKVEPGGALTFTASDDQLGGLGDGRPENDNSLLLTVLTQPGDYVIFATTADVEPNGIGNYTLNFRTGVITPLSYSATAINAAINSTDILTSASNYLDAYWFQGTQGDRVQIDMKTTAFDAYLLLNDFTGDLLSYDDNSGDGNEAQISPTSADQPLPSLPRTGVYIIIATPYEANRTGAYTLTLQKLPAAATEAASNATQSKPGRHNVRDNFGRGSNFARFASRRVSIPGQEQ